MGRGRGFSAFIVACAAGLPVLAGRVSRVAAQTTRAVDVSDLLRVEAALVDVAERVGRSVVAVQAMPAPRTGAAHGDEPELQRGSGLVIDSRGLILTSEHVIRGATILHVILHDGRRVRAAVQGADARSDLAVLAVTADGLRPAELGDARKVRRGQFVLAMGYPHQSSWDGQAAVTLGIVSAIGRGLPESFGSAEDRYYGDLIQASAPIQPGNSGGPLIDVRGRVIGIVTAITTRSGAGEGVGYAVPIDDRTRGIIARLENGQPIEYGYLGVGVAGLEKAGAGQADHPDANGVAVLSVEPGGPAAQAGLLVGDVVTHLNDRAIGSDEAFVRLVGEARPGETLHVRYRRGRSNGVASVVVSRREARPGVGPSFEAREWRGALLSAVPASIGRGRAVTSGALLVVEVASESPAERAGLEPGDVVIRIGGRTLDTPEIAQTLLDRSTGDALLGLSDGAAKLVSAR